jgi:hypothetical protein
MRIKLSLFINILIISVTLYFTACIDYGWDNMWETDRIETFSATNISSRSATLKGGINPCSQSYTVTFQYGTTISYGYTKIGIFNNKQSPENYSATISELVPNTTYHYSIKAVVSGVDFHGIDVTFTTLAK